MKLWNRFEQFFKHKLLRFAEKFWGLEPLDPTVLRAENIKKILIIRQHDQLGDFLLSTPAFRAVRNRFPHAHISVLVRKYTARLMEHNKTVDRVITFYENGRDWNVPYLKKLWSEIRSGYDLVIVLNTVSHSLTSDTIARLTGAAYVVGSEHLLYTGTSRNFFYNILAPYRGEIVSQSQRNVDIVQVIGCSTDRLQEEIFLTDSEKEKAGHRLIDLGVVRDKLLVGIHPGAGKIPNRWPVERFARAAERLHQTFGCQFFVTWGPSEEALGEQLMRLMKVPYFFATEPDLRKFAALLSQCHLVLCNDTGVMHVAAAVGTPLVAVFGPTDPEQWKPVGDKFVAVRGTNHTCENVTVEQVVEQAEHLLSAVQMSAK